MMMITMMTIITMMTTMMMMTIMMMIMTMLHNNGENTSYAKGQFEIFSSPDLHSRVVAADLEEVFSVGREQTARHGGRPA